MKTKTRHGVKRDEEAETEWAEAAEKIVLAEPEEKRDEMRANLSLYRDRRDWEGDDWPRPNPGPSPKSVAIVGFAHSKLLAPFGEEGWELWCLNDPIDWPGIPARHAFTRWFQLHPPHYLREHHPPGIKDLKRNWGKKTGVRMYMDRHYDEYPDSEPYPRAAVEASVGHGWYHASSFDWMVALAVHEGFEEIALYGCDFYAYPVTNREPLAALPCLSYWLGVAEGRGIKVKVHGGGHLFRIMHMAVYESGLQYGFEREPAWDLGTKGSEPDKSWKDHR